MTHYHFSVCYSHMDSAPPRVQHYFRGFWKPETQRSRWTFATTMPRRVYPLPQSQGAGRHEAGTSLCFCSRSRLGSSGYEDRTTERPGHTAYFGESKDGTGPEWKDITDRSPTYKSCWLQWKSLAVRKGILERHWEPSTEDKKGKLILPRSTVNDVLTELRGGPSEGHRPQQQSGSGLAKLLLAPRQETMLRSEAGMATPVQSVEAPDQEIGMNCISTMSRPHLKEQPSM
jgi:hypothetical protein